MASSSFGNAHSGDVYGSTEQFGCPSQPLVDPIGFSTVLDSNYNPSFLGGAYSVEDRAGDGSVTYLLGSYLAATEASGLRGELDALIGN